MGLIKKIIGKFKNRCEKSIVDSGFKAYMSLYSKYGSEEQEKIISDTSLNDCERFILFYSLKDERKIEENAIKVPLKKMIRHNHHINYSPSEILEDWDNLLSDRSSFLECKIKDLELSQIPSGGNFLKMVGYSNEDEVEMVFNPLNHPDLTKLSKPNSYVGSSYSETNKEALRLYSLELTDRVWEKLYYSKIDSEVLIRGMKKEKYFSIVDIFLSENNVVGISKEEDAFKFISKQRYDFSNIEDKYVTEFKLDEEPFKEAYERLILLGRI